LVVTVPNIPQKLVVNGYELKSKEEEWVRFVANSVVPELLGDRTERIRVAARSSWWGLREGTFALSKPFEHSLCISTTKLKPLETCAPSEPWQVGLAAVQVPNFSEQKVLDVIQALWPRMVPTDVLIEVVELAGFDQSKDPGAAIIASSGDLRKSWLLRHPTVGITLVERNVTPECIDGVRTWCYCDTHPQYSCSAEEERYAPNRQEALESIMDLTTIFNLLVP
jgi:hypothetical protein